MSVAARAVGGRFARRGRATRRATKDATTTEIGSVRIGVGKLA